MSYCLVISGYFLAGGMVMGIAVMGIGLSLSLVQTEISDVSLSATLRLTVVDLSEMYDSCVIDQH